MIYKINNLKRETDIIFLLGSGSSINEITDEQWNVINKNDNLAMNNFFYHPTFIPKFLSLELKTYDFEIARQRINEKWELGWKNVCYITSKNRADYISKAVGHKNESKIYEYVFTPRGNHPKTAKNVKVDANFNPDRELYKSYDASTSTMIHLAYQMGYKTIVMHGFDMNNSLYFWSSGDKIYGKTHCIFNKDHEHNDPKRNHNASHLKDYIIDFNKRHFLPKNREIVISHKTTTLYPHLKLVNIEDYK